MHWHLRRRSSHQVDTPPLCRSVPQAMFEGMQELQRLVPPGDELRPLIVASEGKPDFLHYVLKREFTEGSRLHYSRTHR